MRHDVTVDKSGFSAKTVFSTIQHVAMTLLTPLAFVTVSGCAPEDKAPEWATGSTIRAQALEASLNLANTDTYIIMLDPSAHTLTLSMGATVLREYAVDDVRIARRHGPLKGYVDAPSPFGKAWQPGELSPCRKRIRTEKMFKKTQATADGEEPSPLTAEDAEKAASQAEAQIAQPLLPEDVIVAPDTYTIDFAGGLSVEVVSTLETADENPVIDTAADTAANDDKWRFLMDDINGYRAASPRIRITMPSADARALYRSLPDDVAMIILPPSL